jgi:hypothetical protein
MKHLVHLRRLLLALNWLLAGLACQAQAPAWQMAIAANNPSLGYNSGARATATDAAGNVYIAGSFSRMATFGSITLTSVGPYDMFVAKWSPITRTFVWAKQTTNASPGGYAAARALAVYGGSVYVAGSFSGTAAFFDGLTLSNTGIGNYEDLFVAKLTDAGPTASFAWVQSVGGTRTEVATGLALNENILYVTGHSDSPTTSFGSTTLTNTGNTNGFVAKLLDDGSTGTFGWVQVIAGPSADDVNAVVVANGQLYITGFFYGTSTLAGATLTSAGGADMFVAKLTDQGPTAALGWARALGGAANDFGAGLAVQGAAVYVAGTFNGTTTSFGSTVLTSAGGADACLIKLVDGGPTSTVGWVQKVGGPEGDVGKRVAVKGNAVYLLGDFGISPYNSAITTAVAGATTLTSVGGNDVFLAKYLDAGSTSSLAWVQQAGSQDVEDAGDLTFSGNKMYVCGSFAGPVLLLSPLALAKMYVNGVASAFLASLTEPLLPTTPASALAGLRLWPNPAQGSTAVLVPAGAGAARLTLLDAVGRAVRRQAATPGLATALDLAGLAPGVYVLRVQAGEESGVRRLVVE